MAASDKAGEQSLARIWNDAVFQLASSRGVEDDVLEEWRGLVELLDRDPGLKAVFGSPLVTVAQKRQIIEKSFRGKASDLFVDTLQVLGSKGRLGLVRPLAAAFEQAWMASKNQVEVFVTSAIPLSPELRQSIVAATGRFAGKEAQLRETVDPSILGGLVVRVGDRKFDDSISRELEQVYASFASRGSVELARIQEYIHNSEESSRGV
ncbi:MAG: ATP synthase F1 subunit delta [Thermoanaerobaculia bacterium]